MSTQEVQVIDSFDFSGLDEYQLEGHDVTVENKRAFLAAYRGKASIYHAARAVGIHRRTVHRWLERDPVFAAAFDDCKEDAGDTMETSTYEKALGKPDSDGRYTGGDSLLKMFWLKAYRPQFRDKLQLDIETIDTEIRERLASTDIRQLPAITTSLGLLPAIATHQEVTQNPSESDNQQKSE